MNKEQLIMLQKKYKKLYLVALIFLPVFGVYLWQEYYHHWILTVGLIIVVITLFAMAKETRGEYVHHVFENVYTSALESSFTNIAVNNNLNKMQKEQIANEIARADLKYIEPEYFINPVLAVQAQYGDLPLEMYEYQLIQVKQSKSGTEEKVKFEGRLLKIYLPNPFTGELQLHTFPDPFMDYKKRLEKVEFEDVDFTKQFKVFATSQLDAFRLIKPKTLLHFREVLEKKLSRDLSMDIDLCFLDGCFITMKKAAITHISVPFFKELDFEKAKRSVSGVVPWIKEIVADFKLDSEEYTTGR